MIFSDYPPSGAPRDLALWYAQVCRLAVVPIYNLRPNGNCSCLSGFAGQCESPAKHPWTLHGVNDATTDPATITKLWSNRRGRANIGMATGERSGVGTLDVDVRHGGAESLERLVSGHGPLPLTWRARTGGGGEHWNFQHLFGMRNNVGSIAPGLDIRAAGGYTILPPSVHNSGLRYEWIVSPADAALAPWPPWLLALLPPPRTRPVPNLDAATLEAAANAVPTGLWRYAQLGKREGQRNDGAFWLGCRLVEECGQESSVAWAAMQLFGASCRPRMDGAELWRTWLSACEEGVFSPTVPVIVRYDLATGANSYERDALRSREIHGSLQTINYEGHTL